MRKTFLIGMAMGLADLVPGVSGGTVAFLFGVYDRFLLSLRTFPYSWRFLFPLGLGMGASLLTFSVPIHVLLSQPTPRALLFSAFAGCLCGSLMLFRREIRTLHPFFLFTGLLLTAGATLFPVFTPSSLPMVAVGALAASAMVMPGISGSYLLVLLGRYSDVVHALSRITKMGLTFSWDGEAVVLLLKMALGIVLGFALFSRILQFFLGRYRQQTLSLLFGCVIGGLDALWPYWDRSPTVMEGAGVLFLFLLCGGVVWALGQRTLREDRPPSEA